MASKVVVRKGEHGEVGRGAKFLASGMIPESLLWARSRYFCVASTFNRSRRTWEIVRHDIKQGRDEIL